MIYVIILLVLYVSSWGVVLAKHGEPKEGGLFNVFLSSQ